jgi:hypothetical protein
MQKRPPHVTAGQIPQAALDCLDSPVNTAEFIDAAFPRKRGTNRRYSEMKGPPNGVRKPHNSQANKEIFHEPSHR